VGRTGKGHPNFVTLRLHAGATSKSGSNSVAAGSLQVVVICMSALHCVERSGQVQLR